MLEFSSVHKRGQVSIRNWHVDLGHLAGALEYLGVRERHG